MIDSFFIQVIYNKQGELHCLFLLIIVKYIYDNIDSGLLNNIRCSNEHLLQVYIIRKEIL